MRVASGYRERHSRNTLITCFIMLMIVVGSGYYVITYGLNNSPPEEGEEETGFDVAIELYAPVLNVSGVIRIYNEDSTLFQTLSADSSGNVPGVLKHPIGNYKLYYDGDENDVNFGPVQYAIGMPNSLLVDHDYVGIRVTIRTL